MPGPNDLVGELIRFVGDVLGASSLRFDVGPTLVVIGIVLVFLQLVARPVTRWTSNETAGLAGVGRSMALAAEAGTDAVVSLGTAGLARSTDALGRLQSLAALPVLGHVARAAARSGVPMRVITNDPLLAVAASATVEAAHVATSTRERSGRSRIVMAGEGRGVPAGLAMTAGARPEAAFIIGSLREEAQIQLEGLGGGAGSLSCGTADGAQAASLLVASGDALVGPEPYGLAADLRADVDERTAVLAANRLIGIALVALAAGAMLSAAGVLDPASLLGIGRR
jgi:hypothetical protein